MDPLDGVKPHKDTTYFLMLAAHERGLQRVDAEIQARAVDLRDMGQPLGRSANDVLTSPLRAVLTRACGRTGGHRSHAHRE